jgi:hypothetical protein
VLLENSTSFQSVFEILTQFYTKDIGKLSEAELKAYRKQLVNIGRKTSKALSATSKKEYSVTEEEVEAYVKSILEDGYNLQPTKLSTVYKFIDLQQTVRYKDVISNCVQHSSFSSTKFKYKELAHQRSNIEHSKNLHTLRKAVTDMIGPLKLLKESIKSAPTIQYKLTTEEELIIEVDKLKIVLSERERMLSEIMHLYNEPFSADSLQGSALLKAVEDFKVQHCCNDTEACKVFGVSRSKLARTRKECSKGVLVGHLLVDSDYNEPILSKMTQNMTHVIKDMPYDSLEDI